MNALSLVLLATLSAQADEKSAEDCLHTKVWDGYADGWGIRTLTSSTLGVGATRNYLVTLYKGNEYQIRTCGDDDVANLDVYLYDLNGQVVLQDSSTDRQPFLEYKPTSTSTYYVVVHARSLAPGKTEAGVAMAVTYR